jgi:hypothetical protein
MPRALAALLVAALAVPVLGAVLTSTSAVAAAGPDQLVLSQVGAAGSTLTADPNPVSLVTVNADGTASTTPAVPLPTADSGASHALTLSGTSDAQGSLSRAASGTGLSIGGFGVAPTPGFGDPKGSAAAAVPRVVGWVDASGVVDTTTAVTGAFSGDNIRSVASADGSSFYIAGKDAATGIFQAAKGSTAPTAITSGDKNFRTVGIAGGQLYASSDKTKTPGVSLIGAGLPTASVAKLTAGNTPINTGAITVGSDVGTPDGFVLLDTDATPGVDTAYVIVETSGIYKYALSGASWVAEGSIPGDFESLTGRVAGSGVELFTLARPSAKPDANRLLKYTDAAGSLSAVSVGSPLTVGTAPAGTAWRGVAFAPTGWKPQAPGGGTPTPVAPTIAAATSGLPLALGDQPTGSVALSVDDATNGSDGLTVAVTASTKSAVADAVVTGTGATRSLVVTPLAVGKTSLTVTVTNPVSGKQAATTVTVGVSGAATALDTPSYHSGAADGSTVVDVGGGYMLVADDEDTVIRLYDSSVSGPPVKTWDFAGHFAPGAELDLEASVRVGGTIYWSGSMSNNKSAVYQPARNVFFSTTVTGSGASTALTFVGSYSGLRTELTAWDVAHENRLGLSTVCSTAAPTKPDVQAGCNLEGLEFAPASTSTAYLGFRSPVIAGEALVVPVTNYSTLIGSAAGSASFGEPILLDLGGRSIREIRANGSGQYLITAGVPDDADQSLGWALYRWNGQPTSAPSLVAHLSGVSGAAGQESGSYESIVSVPSSLPAGTRVQLLTDNGTTVFYGDGVAGKDVAPLALQKSVSEWVTLDAAPELPATLSVGTVAAGSTLTVDASGFSAGESVGVWLHSAPIHLADLVADSRGRVSGTVTIPSSAPAGAHAIVLVGARSGVTASGAVTVVAAAVAASGSVLAFTGADANLPLNLALAFLVLGAGLVLWRRHASRAKTLA